MEVSISLSNARPALVVPPPAPRGWRDADATYDGAWPPDPHWSNRGKVDRLDLPRGRDLLERDPERPEEGEVGIVFSTDSDGKVGNCQVVLSSGNADFDRASCEAVRNGSHAPELWHYPVLMKWRGRRLDAQLPSFTNGPNIESGLVMDANLVAGIDVPPATRISVELDIGADGSLQACRLITPSYHDALDRAACQLFSGDVRFTIPRDPFGTPVSATMVGQVDWTAMTIRLRVPVG